MTITEFLLARIAEDEAQAKWVENYGDNGGSALFRPARVLAECAAKRAIVEQHKDWPVLVESKPNFSESTGDLQGVAYRVSQEMAWLTEREYVKRFGVEAPTTNMILALAAVYADHPDYDTEWATDGPR